MWIRPSANPNTTPPAYPLADPHTRLHCPPRTRLHTGHPRAPSPVRHLHLSSALPRHLSTPATPPPSCAPRAHIPPTVLVQTPFGDDVNDVDLDKMVRRIDRLTASQRAPGRAVRTWDRSKQNPYALRGAAPVEGRSGHFQTSSTPSLGAAGLAGIELTSSTLPLHAVGSACGTPSKCFEVYPVVGKKERDTSIYEVVAHDHAHHESFKEKAQEFSAAVQRCRISLASHSASHPPPPEREKQKDCATALRRVDKARRASKVFLDIAELQDATRQAEIEEEAAKEESSEGSVGQVDGGGTVRPGSTSTSTPMWQEDHTAHQQRVSTTPPGRTHRAAGRALLRAARRQPPVVTGVAASTKSSSSSSSETIFRQASLKFGLQSCASCIGGAVDGVRSCTTDAVEGISSTLNAFDGITSTRTATRRPSCTRFGFDDDP